MSYLQQMPHVMGNQFFNGNNNQPSAINGSTNLWSRNNNGLSRHPSNSPRFFGAGNTNHFGGGHQNLGNSIFGPQQQFQQPPPYHPQQPHMNPAANFLGAGQKYSPPVDNWPNFKFQQGQQHPPAPVMRSRKEVGNGDYFNNLHFQSPPGFNGWANGGVRVYGPHQIPTSSAWNAGGFEVFDLNPMHAQHQQHPIPLNFPPGFGPFKFGAQQQFQPPPPYADHTRHHPHQHQMNLWRNEVNQFHQQLQTQPSNGNFNHGFNPNHSIYQPVAALAPLPSPTPVYQQHQHQHQHQKSGGDFGVVGDRRASKGSIDIEMTGWENKVREDDQKISIDQTEVTVIDNSKVGIEEGPIFDPNVDYQLCPTSNPVLPPPPIELSAVPIGSLGYEVIWECCRLSFEKNDGNHQYVPIGFGAIGSEMEMARNLKRRNDGDFLDDSNSETSSVSSSCPGTPGEEVIRPRNFGGFTGKGKGNEWSGFDFPQILQTKIQLMKQEPLADEEENKLDLEPTQNFKNFTNEILEKTLLTPQVLILGIYFVHQVTQVLNLSNLPAESPFANASSAPYRMLVVSLMIANKILDDNSYRSETFASVSGIPLNELNLMEMNFLGALKFETNLDRSGWTRWLSQLLDREKVKKFGDVNTKVEEVLGDILQKTCEEACLNSPSIRSTCGSLMSEGSEESLAITLARSEVSKRNLDTSSPRSYYEIDFDEEYEEENPIPGEYNSRSMMQSSFYQK